MIFLAIRQLMSRKRQTILILLGVSLGTMMYVVISGMQLGLRGYFVSRLLNNSPHVRITAPDEVIREEAVHEALLPGQVVRWITPPSGKRQESRIEYAQGWFDRFQSDPRVVAYAPSLAVNVIISRRDIRFAASLNGVIPERFRRISGIDESMVIGSLADLSGAGNKIIAGTGVLEEVGARVGETVSLSTGSGEPRPFKIVGSFELGSSQVDRSLILAHLSDVQQLNRSPGRIGEISVNLLDMDDARNMADQWKQGARDKVESWQETFANLFQMFYVQDFTRWTISIAILIVAGFGVYNVLSIMITQKQREIAILRSIGYPPRKILLLFFLQGGALGLAGATLGLALGYGLNSLISRVPIRGGAGMGGMGLTHLIVSQAPELYLVAFLMAILSSLIASIMPAHHASRLTPLDIIRNS